MTCNCRGSNLLRDPLKNHGTAYTQQERCENGLRGLLPARVETLQEQADRMMTLLRSFPLPIQRYIVLDSLHNTNETLFFKLVCDHVEELMPIIYTPTVGEACQRFSHDFIQSRGLFISINDKGKVAEILNNVPEDDMAVIVVTDGQRILGLGDQGVNGMGIPIGKLALYTACAGISPEKTLPVVIDVGTNNPDYLLDPLYLGLRHERVTGLAYDELIDEFMLCARRRWPNVLIQFEDFGNVLDDDIESYAIVSETLNLGQKTTLSIKFDDIAVGQEIGLIMSGVTAVANLNVIGVEQIQACYQGQIVAQTKSGSGVGLKVAGNGDKWYISITPTGDPSNKVDELRFVWGDGVSALKNLKIHGAYLRPDYNRDGVVDCVDDALTTQILNLIPLPADICEGNTSILQVSGGEVNKVYSLYIRNYKEESRVFDQTYQVKLTSEAQFEFTGSEGDPIPNLAPGIYYLTIPNPTNPSGTPWIGNVILTIHPKETTWKGTASSNWNDWNNWDRGVPWDCTNVFIPNNVPNYPNLISAENNECWCQNIHFASNAELIGQNNLNYSGKVFIDRELKSGSYHLMSAPLQNMVTGDMFIADNVTDWEEWRSYVTGNTISGELHDNYFQTIQENGNNDGSNYKEQRIDPVVYQRFWSSVVNNATSTRATDNYDNTEDEVIESDILTTDWSRTFNAVEESYGIGQGFAVRVGEEGEISQDYDFHFPKLYNYYHYYSLGSDNPIKESNPIMRDNAGSFWPKTINKNITLRREEAGNLFLFGNPFMTHLNMKNFFIENENILTIYIYDENEKGYETITRDQVTDNAQISPMEAVFLVSNTSTNLSCVIQITDDMFEQGNASGNSYTPTPVEQLSLSVAAHGHTASCSVIPSASASDDYDVREDTSLLVGSEEGSGVAVFTVAGGKALSIQRISQATRIPVGFYLREPGSVRLSFQAKDAYWDGWHLTDTRTGQTYPLDAAVTLEDVSTGSGRFFLEKAQ